MYKVIYIYFPYFGFIHTTDRRRYEQGERTLPSRSTTSLKNAKVQ